MTTDSVYYEDELDAARATVQALGGTKKVGPLFWPEKPVTNAARYLSDCLSPGRSERLSPAQLLFLMRLGREGGAHMLAEYYMAEAGYQRPVPVNPDTEAAVLAHQLDAVLDRATALADRLAMMRKLGASS
ncbi:hypothetical protein [Variovorax sp. UC122_21]|uniref:hypothetical protein n=1 Tax=Variovorax sp. UC122_21 TaxID=3374554 RepID=UPI0037578D67